MDDSDEEFDQLGGGGMDSELEKVGNRGTQSLHMCRAVYNILYIVQAY